MIRTLICLLLMTFSVCACGKKGPLIYPEMLAPGPSNDITVSQSVNSLRVRFSLPQKDLSGRSLKDLDGVNIYKRTLPSGLGPVCSACTSDFELFRKVYVDLPGDAVQRLGNVWLLLDSEVKTGKDYSYYVMGFNKDAIDGKPSKTVTASVVEPPQAPVLKVVAEPTEITLHFSLAVKAGADFMGFNLYRAAKGEQFDVLPINAVPLKELVYVDSGLVRGTAYKYVGTAVVKGPAGNLVESPASNQVETRLVTE